MRVLSNHMFVAHKRQEQNHQQELGGRKRGRRRGAKNKIVPVKNPLSGGGGPEYDLLNPMQEKNVIETEKNCKYGEKKGYEGNQSLVKEDVSEVPEDKLVKQSLEKESHYV